MFDWHDQHTYAPAVKNVESVFLVGPGSASDWSPLLDDFLAASADAGLSRVVMLSARGVEFLADGAVARAEATLREGPLPWVILRPTHFAQNFTEAMFRPIDGKITAPVGDGAEPFIDVADIAEVAAAVLTTSHHDGEIVELSGPESLTFHEAVAIINRHSGGHAQFVDEDRAAHIERLRAAGTPDGYITWRMAMLDGIHSGADAYISDGVERILHRPATGFSDWASREVLKLPHP